MGKLIVPAYFYPTWWSGSDWDTLNLHADKLIAIGNPNSGPGSSINSDYTYAFNQFKDASGTLIGYVPTTYATRSIDDVKTDINNWFIWYDPNGIFLDEMDNTATTASYEYYQEIYRHIKCKNPNGIVIGNPGTVTQEGYLFYNGKRVCDILCCYEDSTDYSSWTNSSWAGNYDNTNFYSICHGCTSWDDALTYLANDSAYYMYITDDLYPNPFDVLTSYLEPLLTYMDDLTKVGSRKVIVKHNIYGEGIYGDNLYGNDKECLIDDNWRYTYKINTYSPLTCKIIDNTFIPIKGEGFELYIDNNLEYGGVIQSVNSVEKSPNFLNHSLQIKDFTILCDKRRVGQSFTNKSAGYIFNWIIDNILVDEGVTAGTIQDGMTFDKVIFAYKTCTECFNYIIDASPGYNWTIDKYKKIHFISKGTNKCNTVVNDNFLHYEFETNNTLDGYVNYLYLDGGRKQTVEFSNYTPSPKPDGESRSFNLPYPLALQPTIETNRNGAGWVAETVGINGITTDKQWYWTYGYEYITQDSAQSVLLDVDAIRVTYTGLMDIKMTIEDEEKIQQMSEISNSTGIYEGVYSDNKISSDKSAYQVGTSIIDKYSNLDNISFYCEDLGDININKLLYVDKPLFGISDWYLVESIQYVKHTVNKITYYVTCLAGESLGSWETYFNNLMNQTVNINNEDVFIQSKLVKDKWDYNGEIIFTITQPLVCSTSLKISETLVMGTYQGGEVLND